MVTYLVNCIFSWANCQSKQCAIFSEVIALNRNGPWYLVHGFSVMADTMSFIQINSCSLTVIQKWQPFTSQIACAQLEAQVFSKVLQYKLHYLQMFWYSECWDSNSLLMNCILMSVSPVYWNDKELIWLCNESHSCIIYWTSVSALYWSMIA